MECVLILSPPTRRWATWWKKRQREAAQRCSRSDKRFCSTKKAFNRYLRFQAPNRKSWGTLGTAFEIMLLFTVPARWHRSGIQLYADRSRCCQTTDGYHQDQSPDRTCHIFLLHAGSLGAETRVAGLYPCSQVQSDLGQFSSVLRRKLADCEDVCGNGIWQKLRYSVTILGFWEGSVHHVLEHGN